MKITNCRSACTTRGIGVARIFDWGGGGGGTKSQVMTSSEIFEKGTFVGQRYCRLEDQKPWPVFARNQDFAIGRGLKPKIKSAKE